MVYDPNKTVKRWFLKKDSDIVAFIEENEERSTEAAFFGAAYVVHSMTREGEIINADFHSDFYLKWDSCTHWYFNGEDYDADVEESGGSYYHLCGAHWFDLHLVVMAFVWEVARRYLSKNNVYGNGKYTTDCYNESKIKDLLLEGYEIVEGE